ncbi:diguanylate cyclase [Chitinibacter sp. S2-10]|uniref:diguanylate cyclase n=1 Tax=Chitinibacter sp. S2-10 TaxID=3373597 RepID=UPI00397756A7
MTLRRLFLIFSLLLSVTVITVTVRSVQQSFVHLHNVGKGQAAMAQLQALFMLTEMASRERESANDVLNDTTSGGDLVKLVQLQAARAKTNRAFAELLREISDSAALTQTIELTRQHLTLVRQSVDETIGKVPIDRKPDEVRSVIEQMIAVIDDLTPAITLLSNDVLAYFPSATNRLTAARLTANLREYAGQLGSQLATVLVKQQLLTLPERLNIESLRGRIELLNQYVSGRAAATAESGTIKAANRRMQQRYFAAAWLFVDYQIKINLLDASYTVDAAEFVDYYAPQMESIADLRNVLMREAVADAAREVSAARSEVLLSSVLGLLTLGILACTLWLIQRRVIRPLSWITGLIVDISAGKLQTEIPKSGHQDEMAEVIHAIEDLRLTSLARQALEQERLILLEQQDRQNLALASQQALLQNILDHAPINIAFVTDQQIRFANQKCIETFGVQPGDRSPSLFVNQAERENLLAQLNQQGILENREVQLYNHQQQIRIMQTTFIAVTLGGEEGILAWLEDITDAKAAEQQIAEQRRAMQQLLDYSPVGMVFSTQGIFRYTNAEFEKKFDAYAGDRAESIYLTMADRAEVLALTKQQGLLSGREMWMKGPGGERRLFLGTFLPLVYNGEEGLMGWLMDITERRAAEETIRKMALYDQLTGLPNRRLLEERLLQLLALMQREKQKMAVLFLDLDRFKQVNDEHGHDAGDWLLIEVARRMNSCLRQSDTAARIGGDEFVVLLPDAHAVKDAVAVAEKIRLALEQAFVMPDGTVLDISSSIGVVMYPDQADNPADLLRFGDEAMYAAKKRGRNAVEVFVAD